MLLLGGLTGLYWIGAFLGGDNALCIIGIYINIFLSLYSSSFFFAFQVVYCC